MGSKGCGESWRPHSKHSKAILSVTSSQALLVWPCRCCGVSSGSFLKEGDLHFATAVLCSVTTVDAHHHHVTTAIISATAVSNFCLSPTNGEYFCFLLLPR